MRCEVLAIGTELLLGQIVDTNSAWIGEQLAASGIDSYEHRVVGDNQPRIVAALRDMLERSDAVIICGGLGPTQDDLTRDAIVELMGVGLRRREDLVELIAAMFSSRARDMPQNNLRQADVPDGGEPIPNPIGTAPGPELPDRRQGRLRGPGRAVRDAAHGHRARPSRSARACGRALGHRVAVAEDLGHVGVGTRGDDRPPGRRADQPDDRVPRAGIEGLVVRVTAKAATEAEARRMVEAEEAELRRIIGDLVFGVDDETMEYAVLARLRERGWSLGVAESVTGGLIGARIANVPGASDTFRGTIGAYATDVKRSVLGVTAELVVSEESAIQMAVGAQRVLGADVGIAVTGVAGPTEQDNRAVGTVFFAIAVPGHEPFAVSTRLPGDRERIRQFATISLLNLVRQRLDALPD